MGKNKMDSEKDKGKWRKRGENKQNSVGGVIRMLGRERGMGNESGKWQR